MSNQKDFIAVFENAYSKEYCEDAIQHYENLERDGKAFLREVENALPLEKDDSTVFIHNEDIMALDKTKELLKTFNEIFWNECYKKYATEFSVLRILGEQYIRHIRLQKTSVGGGYHLWHCEDDSEKNSKRILVWALYLNDVEEGGETEFLYQHKRIKAKQGTLVIWPAAYTHTHRGNPPLSNTKYIMTGWVEF